MLNQKNSYKLVELKNSNPVAWKKIEGYCIATIIRNDSVKYEGEKYPVDFPTSYDWNIGLLEKVDHILGECGVFEDVLGTYSMKTYHQLLQLIALHSNKLRYILG